MISLLAYILPLKSMQDTCRGNNYRQQEVDKSLQQVAVAGGGGVWQ